MFNFRGRCEQDLLIHAVGSFISYHIDTAHGISSQTLVFATRQGFVPTDGSTILTSTEQNTKEAESAKDPEHIYEIYVSLLHIDSTTHTGRVDGSDGF